MLVLSTRWRERPVERINTPKTVEYSQLHLMAFGCFSSFTTILVNIFRCFLFSSEPIVSYSSQGPPFSSSSSPSPPERRGEHSHASPTTTLSASLPLYASPYTNSWPCSQHAAPALMVMPSAAPALLTDTLITGDSDATPLAT